MSATIPAKVAAYLFMRRETQSAEADSSRKDIPCDEIEICMRGTFDSLITAISTSVPFAEDQRQRCFVFNAGSFSSSA
jgi:hypothetical protein